MALQRYNLKTGITHEDYVKADEAEALEKRVAELEAKLKQCECHALSLGIEKGAVIADLGITE